MTAKMSVSANPITSSATPAERMICRSGTVTKMCRAPASSSVMNRCSIALEARLDRSHQCHGDDHRGEGRRVQNRNCTAAEGRIERGTHERRQQAQPFAHRLEDRVRVTEQLAREDHRHQGGARRRRNRAARAVDRRHDVEQPEITPVVHE